MTKDEVSEFEDEHLTTTDGPMWMELPLVSAAGLDDGVGEGASAVVKLEEDEDMANLVHVKATDETEDQDVDPTQMVSVVGTGGSKWLQDRDTFMFFYELVKYQVQVLNLKFAFFHQDS